ncbi:bifunctional nicotinamide-nucleotide adenylyltransferase/Nudix hydroxylase [Caldimonas tepidiphila]|uniref:bifunctional nicotinamide-nucleotide adenylyltransferase/Nudix hydroxylase n=1 Tax=Caldimonas tepidiphila TaxID=2315841 RepID=UPI000E5C1EDA|nr:bifunctional nicotinamide-nucleotide adenylyltransferase/Nudix hydroxylase [Caldimonas tepidiphila]
MTLPATPDAAVCIGRFQPFHNGHLALLRHALSLAPRCIVVLGSAQQARTPRNPFTWRERAEMIGLALPPKERERLRFVPVRDHYELSRWSRAVRHGVAACLADEGLAPEATRVLVGRPEDEGWNELRRAAGWSGCAVEQVPGADGTRLRDVLFQGAADIDAVLAALVDQVPASTRGFLRAWAALPFHAELVQEWRMLKRYREEWAAAPYPPVFVTVDTVLRCADHVLLVKRGRAPGKGLLALPGGFIEQRETAWQSALRELREETQLVLPDEVLQQALRRAQVFDHPDRSQRGRTITHAHYLDLGDRPLPEVQGGDDAAAALWVPLQELAALEDRFLDDHFHVLDHFLGLIEPDTEAARG